MPADIWPAIGPSGQYDYKKLLVDADGKLLTSATGTVNISAPTGPFSITVTSVSDTAADPLGGSPLAARVSIAIRNKSATVTLYFGSSAAVTADDTATGGWEIGPGEDFNIDLDDSEAFYLIAPGGESAVVKILEIAST